MQCRSFAAAQAFFPNAYVNENVPFAMSLFLFVCRRDKTDVPVYIIHTLTHSHTHAHGQTDTGDDVEHALFQCNRH